MFFNSIKAVIKESDVNKKISLFYDIYNKRYEFEDKTFHSKSEPEIFEKPSYANFCTIVKPSKVPRRRGFETPEKKAVFLHAIVHIEYSAIDLALDACYRFRNLPKEFYLDWLEVADDEVRHFNMLNNLLENLGYKYGDYPVHDTLFLAGKKTQELISRMAVVPRWYEANGLDANDKIIKKLSHYKNDTFIKKIIDSLRIILKEEIPHVQKGDKWFKWACEKEGLEPLETYFKVVNEFIKNWKKTDLNIAARLKAGFTCDELKMMSNKQIDC